MTRRFIPDDNKIYSSGQQLKLKRFAGVRTQSQLLRQATNAGVNLGVQPATQLRRALQHVAGRYNNDVTRVRRENVEKQKIIRKNTAIRNRVTRLSEGTFKEYLRSNAGHRVRIRFYEPEGPLSQGSKGTNIRNVTYNIPGANEFNNWYVRNIQWSWDYPENVWDEHPGARMLGYRPSRGMTDARVAQAFAHGITNCLLTPILNWGISQESEAKSLTSKKRYSKFVRDVMMLLNKYPNAVPEEDLQSVADLLQIKIEVVFAMPNSVPFISVQSSKKFLRTFKFINTRVDHVELNSVVSDDPEVVTQEFMQELLTQQTDQIVFYNKNTTGVSSVNTINAKYILEDEYRECVNKFEQDTGFSKCKIDHISEPGLSKFVRAGTHFNCTVDYEPIWEQSEDGFEYLLDETGIRHIDMEKAYTQHRASKYYCGFMNMVHHFRVTDRVQGIGLWVIEDLDYSGVCDNTREHLETLNVYSSGQIYTNGDLAFLTDVGATYRVTAGAWSHSPIHFDFPDEMVNGVFVCGKQRTKYYCKWVGSCFSAETDNMLFTKGNAKFCKVLKQGGVDAQLFGDDEICMVYPKKSVYHSSQVAAYVTAYTRLNVLEQLIQFDTEQIVRVCVDGIYYRPRKFNQLNTDVENLIQEYVGQTFTNTFRSKDDMTFMNKESESGYTSGYYDGVFKGCMTPRDGSYKTEAHIGVGGGGKTHANLVDTGLQRVLYVAPSWKLARNKSEGYDCNVSVTPKILTDPDSIGQTLKHYNVLIIDECSMITNHGKESLMKHFGRMLIIFCGDIGYQLPPTQGDEMTLSGIERVVQYNVNRRCDQGDKLGPILDKMRKYMSKGKYSSVIIPWVYSQFQSCVPIYTVQDMILATSHMYKDEWTAKYGKKESLQIEIKRLNKKPLKDKKDEARRVQRLKIFTESSGGNIEDKWYCKDNNKEYSTGQIVIGDKPIGVPAELQHAHTVHSIQGETAQNQLIIDKRGITDARMLYTAISRAKRFSQIILV